jgi:predicted enzyme related to lactoylglutathione lyase
MAAVVGLMSKRKHVAGAGRRRRRPSILVNLDVPDLGPAIEFYAAAVGTKLGRLLDDDVAELTFGAAILYLLRKPPNSSATVTAATRRFDRHWTPVHVDFVVDDIDAAVARALAAGATRESDCIAWRGSKCVTFSDPYGHGFCLIELTGSGYE